MKNLQLDDIYVVNTDGTVEYTYDGSGNRLTREINVVNLSPQGLKSSSSKPLKDVWGERTVTVYPNPTRGFFSIRIQGGNSDSTQYFYTLYDISGAVKRVGSIEGIGENPISISDLQTGTYILQLNHNGEVKTIKIIKN